MNEREYNEAEGIRRSDLWLMNDSPEKFRWHMDHPEEEEKSPAMVFGSAAHKLILEGKEEFEKEYAVAPTVDRRTKEGKAVWEQFSTENTGKVVVSKADYDTMAGMNLWIDATPLANELLCADDVQHEVPFFWTDPETGEKCKCKADAVKTEDGRYVMIDYKTASDARTDVFNGHIFKLGYHVQAAMYTEGMQIALGLDYRPRFLFVVQEKKEPYSVNVIEVGEDVMNYGDAEYHRLLQKYHECSEADIWEGYIQDGMANEAYLPGWLSIGEEE